MNKNRIFSLFSLVALSSVLVGSATACGDSEPEPSSVTAGTCGADFTPCGGELSGTWKVQSGCLNNVSAVLKVPGCQGITIKRANEFIEPSGSISFVNQNYTSESLAKASGVVTMPKECFTAFNAKTCADLTKNVEIASPLVTETETACEFRGVLGDDQPTQETGTYTTASTTVSFKAADGREATSEYCVTGNQLTVKEVPSADADIVVTGFGIITYTR